MHPPVFDGDAQLSEFVAGFIELLYEPVGPGQPLEVDHDAPPSGLTLRDHIPSCPLPNLRFGLSHGGGLRRDDCIRHHHVEVGETQFDRFLDLHFRRLEALDLPLLQCLQEFGRVQLAAMREERPPRFFQGTTGRVRAGLFTVDVNVAAGQLDGDGTAVGQLELE